MVGSGDQLADSRPGRHVEVESGLDRFVRFSSAIPLVVASDLDGVPQLERVVATGDVEMTGPKKLASSSAGPDGT